MGKSAAELTRLTAIFIRSSDPDGSTRERSIHASNLAFERPSNGREGGGQKIAAVRRGVSGYPAAFHSRGNATVRIMLSGCWRVRAKLGSEVEEADRHGDASGRSAQPCEVRDHRLFVPLKLMRYRWRYCRTPWKVDREGSWCDKDKRESHARARTRAHAATTR